MMRCPVISDRWFRSERLRIVAFGSYEANSNEVSLLRMCRASLLLLLLSLLFLQVSVAVTSSSGLRLTSKTIPDVDERTWISLTPFRNEAVPAQWTLRFDMRFWSKRYYGPVVHITLGDSSVLNIVFGPNAHPDTAHIICTYKGQQVGPTLDIDTRSIHRRDWIPVSIRFGDETGRAVISFGTVSMETTTLRIPPNPSVVVQYGVQRKQDGSLAFWGQDMPGLDLRDIRVERAGGVVVHHWPLNESTGTGAADVVGGQTGRVEGAIWLATKHSRWRRIARFPMWRYAHRTYDPKHHRVLVLEAHGLQSYSIEDEILTNIPFVGPRSMQAAFVVYNETSDQLYAYFPGLGPVSRFDESTGMWSPIDSLKSLDLHYFTANGFSRTPDGAPMSLGGYGWYTVKNHLNRYSFERKRWELIPLKGDSLLPRAAVIVGNGPAPGTYYIFGGYGNETGRQDLGFRPLYDLARLDLRDSSVTMLWTRSDLKMPYWMLGYLVPDEEQRFVYGIWCPDDSSAPGPMLVRIGVDSASFEPIGDPFPRGTTPQLFYDPDLAELIAVSSPAGADSILEIYTLAFPPSSDVEPTIVEATLPARPLLMLFIAALSLSLAFMWIVVRRKRRQSAELPDRQIIDTVVGSTLNIPGPITPGARISLFGTFEVIDAAGIDVTSRFTPRLQQLFLLLLMNTYPSKKKDAGTSLAAITETLWPEVDALSAKNSRGVAMRSLRLLLKTVGGISIGHRQQRYTMVIPDIVTCDYVVYRGIVSRALEGHVELSDLTALNGLVHRGCFLEDVHFEWVEAFKTEVMFETTRLLLDYKPDRRDTAAIAGHVHGLAAVIAWDPLNERAMTACVQGMTAMGLHGDAKRTYENFVQAYRKDIGKHFPRSLKDILEE